MIKNVIQFIHGASPEDIQLMVQAIKLRRDQLHFQQAQSFKVGDTVQFTGRRGRTEQGTVTRVKVKYVSVDTGTSKWNIPGGLLRLIPQTVTA